MPDTIEIYDTLDQYPWQYVQIFYEFGPEGYQMAQRVRFNDDETRVEETFHNGILTEMLQFDESEDGAAAPWEYVSTQFDHTGVIQSRSTYFDDGRVFTQTYQDGLLAECFRTDEGTGDNPDGIYNWEVSITQYDLYTGRAREHFILFDDGSEQETRYRDDGSVESIARQDSYEYYPDGMMGSYDWQSQYTMFNELGEITDRYIDYDDGGWTTEQYQGGQLYNSQSYDGSESNHSWEYLDVAYDENGELIHRHYQFDDGTDRTENYQDGLIYHSYSYNPNSDPETGASWMSVRMDYDEFGELFHREVENYNGTRKIDHYDDGVLMRSDSYDHFYGPDGQAWEQQSFLFDLEGDLEAKGIAWDTGDTEVTFYGPDGTSEHRYYDGDDSNDWQARTTFYDDTGAVVWVEEYADEDPLPPDYIPYDLFNGGGYYV